MSAGAAKFRVAAAAAALLAAACFASAALAQRGNDVPRFEEAPMPPRFEDLTPAEQARANEPPAAGNPNRARLAPLPEDRPVDEIVVTGEGSWRRLPDLGSDWRAREEAERERRRYVFAVFPRDENRATEPLRESPFLVNRSGLPSGEIDIVRFRFGRRDERGARRDDVGTDTGDTGDTGDGRPDAALDADTEEAP